VNKQQIRETTLLARRMLAKDDVIYLSNQIARNLFSLPEFRDARVIATYVAKSDEAQTEPIITEALRSGKQVIVPRSDPSTLRLSFSPIKDLKELKPGTFGIPEPHRGQVVIPLVDSDLVLVPVVAWDPNGNRIGYGKGYFDRELKSRGRAPAVGLAFEMQRHDIIPADSGDERLDMLITETGIHRFRKDAR
jgi:5-formyltetrahydrofolate cyclo-ligase